MSEPDGKPRRGEVIDERTLFTTVEVCRCCGIEAGYVEELVAEGILEPADGRGGQARFRASSVRRARITVRLQRDLGVNLAGAALALELLDRIEELDSRLRTAAGR